MKAYKLAFAIISFFSISMIISCQPDEGIGGFHTISGNVITVELDENTLDTLDQYGSPDTRVYLTYGENEIYDDDTRTQYDGQYKFEYLYPGDYKVYTYSECLNCPGGVEAIIKYVEITDKKGETQLDDINILKYK